MPVPDGRLSAAVFTDLDRQLAGADAALAQQYPGGAGGWQPVHTLYVPADEFSAETVAGWGSAALDLLDDFLAGPADLARLIDIPAALAKQVLLRVVHKLSTEPVEDVRIDLEDGYGHPDDPAEDAATVAAAATLARCVRERTAPRCAGLRFKSLQANTRRRGVRSLDLFLGELLTHGPLPHGFRLTLPKVTSVDQVRAMVSVCEHLEAAYALPSGALSFEVQVETPQAVLGPDGAATLARCVHAGAGRLTGLHYGTYDYSAALGVAAAWQSLEHPAADHAKAVMQVAAAGTAVAICDGSTNVLPVGSRSQVRAAWRLHARLVRRSLERGFYQGWDLHPGQLVTRYAATYAFYLSGLEHAVGRLRTYLARRDGAVLDEPATAAALAGYLTRAVACGAADEAAVCVAVGVDAQTLGALAGHRTLVHRG